MSQHLALVLDELGLAYGALHHAAQAALAVGAVSAEGGAGGNQDVKNRWLNLASRCKDMCLFRCSMAALDRYLSLACTAARCRGVHVRTVAVDAWLLRQRAGALLVPEVSPDGGGSLALATRVQLLTASLGNVASRCSREGATGAGAEGDVPVVGVADVAAMPVDAGIVAALALCEARRIRAAVGAPLPPRRAGTQAGQVRVGYLTVVDGCRVHNSLMRAVFDAGVGGHARSAAVSYVWGSHLVERRAGYASGGACIAPSSTVVELGEEQRAREVAARINADGIHVLVELWGWAPLGRSVGTLEVLALRPAPVSAVLLAPLVAPAYMISLSLSLSL